MTAYNQGGTPPIMRYFAFEHLPPNLQKVSKPFAEMAAYVVATTHAGAEQSAGLRKLLEAKDCFVRAALAPEGGT